MQYNLSICMYVNPVVLTFYFTAWNGTLEVTLTYNYI